MEEKKLPLTGRAGQQPLGRSESGFVRKAPMEEPPAPAAASPAAGAMPHAPKALPPGLEALIDHFAAKFESAANPEDPRAARRKELDRMAHELSREMDRHPIWVDNPEPAVLIVMHEAALASLGRSFACVSVEGKAEAGLTPVQSHTIFRTVERGAAKIGTITLYAGPEGSLTIGCRQEKPACARIFRNALSGGISAAIDKFASSGKVRLVFRQQDDYTAPSFDAMPAPGQAP
jgi:hypothetical protein